MGTLRRLLRLSHRDRMLLMITVGLMMAVRLGLWLLPFQLLLKLLERLASTRPGSIQRPRSKSTLPQTTSQGFDPSPRVSRPVSTIVWAVEVSSRYMPGGVLCLARALTTQVLLRWEGYQPELRIGVMKGTTGALAAHAWIEHQGQVVMGNLQELSGFIPLPSLEGVKR